MLPFGTDKHPRRVGVKAASSLACARLHLTFVNREVHNLTRRPVVRPPLVGTRREPKQLAARLEHLRVALEVRRHRLQVIQVNREHVHIQTGRPRKVNLIVRLIRS